MRHNIPKILPVALSFLGLGIVRPSVGIGNLHARALQCIHHEPHSEQHKRDAQQLPHVQSHVGFESHLRVLDELYAEARPEHTDKESAEQK